MTDFRILPPKQFDYVNTGNPTIATNPPYAGATWLNLTTGELFFCIDNTAGLNTWVGQLGTSISISVGLNLHYTMDNISGATLVDEQGNLDLTITGASPVVGVDGNALDFTGATDVATSGNATYFNSFTALTVSIWLYPTGTPDGYSGIIGNLQASSYDGFTLQHKNATTVRWFGFGSNASTLETTITPDEWVHLVGTWSGSGIELFKNGSSVGSQALGTNIIGSADVFMLGKLSYSPLYISGYLDNVRVYDRVLNNSEITALYEASL